MKIQPVVLCGGGGARLWPTSTADKPKPFLSLLGDRTLYQQTLARLDLIENALPPIVVTGRSMLAQTARQAEAIGKPIRLIVEPEGRDSGPAIAAAAQLIEDEDPDAVVLMLASDHAIDGDEAFRQAVSAAALAAQQDMIVTFGVAPEGPATSYGYIRAGAPLSEGVRRVAAFYEKPDLARAQAYVAEGYLWNSGNFVFQPKTLLGELRRFEPDMADAVAAALREATIEGGQILLSSEAFRTAPKRSIDYAVMERTDKAAVVASGFSWSDLGAWDAIWTASDKDEAGNAVAGRVALHDSRGVLARSDGPPIAAAGLENLIIVAEAGGVLVLPRDRAQQVRQLAASLPPAAPPPAMQLLATEGDTEVRMWRLPPGASETLPAGVVQVLSGDIAGLGPIEDGLARTSAEISVSTRDGCVLLTTSQRS